MTIMPIMNVNNSYSIKPNVIPPVGSRKVNAENQVNFGNGGSGAREESSHWFRNLVLLCIGGFVAYKYLRKPVSNLVKELQKENFTELFRKAEKKEVATWGDVEDTMKAIAKKNKDAQKGFVYRLNDAQRTEYQVPTKEGIAIGYREGNAPIVEKTIACEALDDKLSQRFEGKSYISFV